MPAQDDVEEFAALLRGLKARTDRSYGSLARRLNMNTSTLHRYCAGDAVPLDFAPVERFAALCAASPEERLELHRRWILAVAARGRSRASGPAGTTPDAAQADATTSDDTTSGDASSAPAATKPGDAPSATTSATAPATAPAAATPDDASSAAAATKPGDAPSAPDAPPPPGTPAVAPAQDGGASGIPDEPKPAARPGPWYRRRLTVTAALASTLLAVLGSLSALSTDDTSSDTARTSGPSLPTAAGPGRPSSAAPSGASPDVHRSSPSASSSPSAKTSASPAKSGEAPTGNTVDRPGSAVVPLAWTVNSQVWELGCAHNYVIDKPPRQVPPPPVEQDAAAWAGTQGAVHGRDTMVQISVQGRTSTAVVLEALRVRVVGRDTPARGTVYAMEQGCGGELTPRSFAVDLDAHRPTVRSLAGADSDKTIPAMRMPYRVSAQDPEVLLVKARTESCDCRWYLELDWSSQGRTGTVRIDDHGRPFRTSGITGLPRYWYSGQGWTPADE
ncbi:helix-turn-helix domain-containing protein [Streptomyces avermitilis]|uniref:helix-turn-helix domain-containing protein n=1 Tax=Streptomyces avermitilis TaxID=33903 RepID=UPI00382BBB48